MTAEDLLRLLAAKYAALAVERDTWPDKIGLTIKEVEDMLYDTEFCNSFIEKAWDHHDEQAREAMWSL